MFKYFFVIMFFLSFPISSYAYNKDINIVYENILKETQRLLERRCPEDKNSYCYDTIIIIDVFLQALNSCFNNDLSNSEKIVDELNTINRLLDHFPSGEHFSYDPYKELSFILINREQSNMYKVYKDPYDNFLLDYRYMIADDSPPKTPPLPKSLYFDKGRTHTYFELYIILAYALNKYNKVDSFKIYTPDFLRDIELFKQILDKNKYKMYKKLYLEYANRTEIINRFFQFNYLKIDNSIPYNDLNVQSKIKRNLYDAFFYAETNDVLKKRIDSIKISTELKNFNKSEQLYYAHLYQLSKLLVGEKKQLLSNADDIEQDIYLKLRFNALYLFYLVITNQSEKVIDTQYDYLNKILKENKNKMIKDYENNVVPYNFYSLLSEFIKSIV